MTNPGKNILGIKLILKIIALLLIIFLSLICLDFGEIWTSINYYIRDMDREHVEKIKSIQVGMHKEDIVKILGRPDRISTKKEISLTSSKVVENRNECLLYYHGIDYFGAYFLDEVNIVYYVHTGGT